MPEPRFTVLVVEGWEITPTAPRPRIAPGVTATVYDRAYDREIASYRSEDEGGRLGPRRALRRATEHAAVLNGEEASATKGTGSSGPCC